MKTLPLTTLLYRAYRENGLIHTGDIASNFKISAINLSDIEIIGMRVYMGSLQENRANYIILPTLLDTLPSYSLQDKLAEIVDMQIDEEEGRCDLHLQRIQSTIEVPESVRIAHENLMNT